MIYVTSFDGITKQVTSLSIDSMFLSLDEVINAIGDEYIKATKRLIIYENVVFSDFPFRLDSLIRCSVCNGPPCAYPSQAYEGCINE